MSSRTTSEQQQPYRQPAPLANIYTVERKATGCLLQGEPIFYYEKSYQFPGQQQQVVLEDHEPHTASHPFCPMVFCACHWFDLELIRRLHAYVVAHRLTDREANAIFFGRAPCPDEVTA